MRPQGFLGRAFAHSQKELGLAENPNHWTDDDVLRALCQAGVDLPGNLIVGARSFDRFMHAGPAAPVSPDRYPDLANAAMHGALPGSSAGGDQPKFCTVRETDGQHVIVKFSPAGDSAPELRWADLLVCEHLALRVLSERGHRAADTRIFIGGGRTMLEVERFDRTPHGRIGMVSLLALTRNTLAKWTTGPRQLSGWKPAGCCVMLTLTECGFWKRTASSLAIRIAITEHLFADRSAGQLGAGSRI